LDEPLFSIALVLYVISMFVVVPAAVVAFGWVRWVYEPKQRSVCGFFSLIGFTSTTLSCVLAIFSAVYGYAHWMVERDRLPIKFERCGLILSLAGLGLGIIGLGRPSPLRWYAPGCALGIILLWFVVASPA
jgi:hypothetical protein